MALPKAAQAARRARSLAAPPSPPPEHQGEQGTKTPAAPPLKELFRAPPLAWKPFPVEALPEPLRTLTIAGARDMGIDPAYIAVPGLACAAGLVNGARWVSPKNAWREPCTLWAVTVADSGIGKTQGLDVTRRLLVNMQKQLDDDGDGKDIFVTDVNIASVKKVLKKNKTGTLLAKDEISSFLAMLTMKGTGKLSGQMGDWAELDQGGMIRNRRTTDDDANVNLYCPLCSIAGTIQPSTLFQLARGQLTDTGIVFRFQYAAPPPQLDESDETSEIDQKMLRAWEDCLRKLKSLEGQEVLVLSPEAKRLFWDKEIGFKKRNAKRIFEAETSAHRSLYSKMKGRVLRYALIVHLIESPVSELGLQPVSGPAMAKAIEIVEWFVHEGRRMLAMRHESGDEARLRSIVDRISAQHGFKISLRNLARLANFYGKDGTERTKALAEAIAAAGYGDVVQGRRKDSLYVILKTAEGESEAEEPDAEDDDEADEPVTVPALKIEDQAVRNMPVGKLDIDPDTWFVLKRANLTEVDHLLELGRDSGLGLREALAQRLPDLSEEAIRRLEFAVRVTGSPKPLLCADCKRMIGFDVRESKAGLCLTCQEMKPATIPMPEPVPTQTTSRKRKQQ